MGPSGSTPTVTGVYWLEYEGGSQLVSPPQEEPPVGTGSWRGLAGEEEVEVVAGVGLWGVFMPCRELRHYAGGLGRLLKSLEEWTT